MNLLRIISICCAVRLYGQSSYSKKINGRFSIDCYCTNDESVDLFEGHVNKMGIPQRVISFVDNTEDWSIAQRAQNSGNYDIFISKTPNDIRFFVERAVVEVTASSEDHLVGNPYRGQVRLPEDADSVFSVYEVEAGGNRHFYLTGSLRVLLKVSHCIQLKGECLVEQNA